VVDYPTVRIDEALKRRGEYFKLGFADEGGGLDRMRA
jgi:hypothetical protein